MKLSILLQCSILNENEHMWNMSVKQIKVRNSHLLYFEMFNYKTKKYHKILQTL